MALLSPFNDEIRTWKHGRQDQRFIALAAADGVIDFHAVKLLRPPKEVGESKTG